MFVDSVEYLRRRNTPFSPPNVSVAEIRAAIPPRLFEKSTFKSLCYVTRDVLFASLLFMAALGIDGVPRYLGDNRSRLSVEATKWVLWIVYWWWQGLVFGGWWTLGHEAGHGSLSDNKWVNDTIGLSLHTFLLIPYYSWRRTHHNHHKATGAMERDENFVPRTRSHFGLPPQSVASTLDYHELFEEAPLYTLLRMLLMQLIGWQTYLFCNTGGSPSYPPGTNHFVPSSPLFKPSDRRTIVVSNIGLGLMLIVLLRFGFVHGFPALARLYVVPYLVANHWVVLLTFLQHTDPTIPHYRNAEWSFVRGALATVDRPLLGWMGRVFLHNISHDHVAHHFFSSIPFYNQPEVTQILRAILGDHYNYDSSNTFWAFYRNFKGCCFVEDHGGVLFYKGRNGRAERALVGTGGT
ncbi:fatty acid desaturase-domain-containing protein [Amylostereum chailletii]|nr:fatty acid desaturase-domain-containing protein [Amylostereum chailletii]